MVHRDSIVISRADLERAAAEESIGADVVERLWGQLSAAPSQSARDGVTVERVLYLVGGLIVLVAMGIFLSLGVAAFGAGALMAISIVYVAVLAGAAARLDRRGMSEPAGLLALVAVGFLPLAIHGFMQVTGLWHEEQFLVDRGFEIWDRAQWIPLELAVIGAGVLALRRYRLPLTAAPIAIALWALAMDVATTISNDELSLEARAWVSLGVGAAIIVPAIRCDRSPQHATQSMGFFLHLVGVCAAGFAVVVLVDPWSSGVVGDALWLVVTAVTLAVGTLLQRGVYLLAGSVALCAYVSYLAWEVFADSVLLPFALTALGLGIVATGIWVQRNHGRFQAALLKRVPYAMRLSTRRAP